MGGGIDAMRSTGRRRRSRAILPLHIRALDFFLFALLLLIPAGVMWVYGGNVDWIWMPVILGILIVAGLFVYRSLISTYRSDLVVPPGGISGLLFFCYLLFTIPLADIPYEAQLETFRFASYLLMFWMLVNFLRDRHRWKWALGIALISASVMASYALIQEAQGSRMVLFQERPSDYAMRASGAFICPNHFAHVMQMAILVSLGILFSTAAGLPLKLFAGYTILVCLYPVVLSLSRAGWIGLMFGSVVVALVMALRHGIRRFIVVLVVAPALVLALGIGVWKLSPEVQQRVTKTLGGDIRVALWKDTLDIIRDAPWMGNGLGSYRYVYPSYQQHMSMYLDPEFAHNDYLHFASEIGLVGLFLAGLFVAAILWRCLRVAVKDKEGGQCALMAGLIGMIAGSLAHTFFDFNFNIFGCVHFYIILVAALIAATYNKAFDTTLATPQRIAPWVGLFLIFSLGFAAWIYAQRTATYFYHRQGEIHARDAEYEKAEELLAKAVAWSPNSWKAHVIWGHTIRAQAFWMRVPDIRGPLIERAEREYKITRQLNPWSPEPHYGLGLLARMKDDEEGALAHLRRAVELAPRYTHYLNELGHQLRRMRKHREALEVFSTSLSISATPVAQVNVTMLQKRVAELEAKGN